VPGSRKKRQVSFPQNGHGGGRVLLIRGSLGVGEVELLFDPVEPVRVLVNSRAELGVPAVTGCHLYFARRVTFLPCADMKRTGCGNRLRIRSQLPTSGVPKLTNRPSAIAKWITHSEQILLRRQQQPRPGSDDREQITRARQAAEALFRSKPPVSGPAVPASAPADQSARKPRVLQIISPAVPVRHEERETAAAPEPQTMRKIPRSQFGRIRTLVKYGMTVAQVAKVYGVDAGEIARILRRA
jgi:hypothetical protein